MIQLVMMDGRVLFIRPASIDGFYKSLNHPAGTDLLIGSVVYTVKELPAEIFERMGRVK